MIRSELKRTGFARKLPTEAKPAKVKTRKCPYRECRKPFVGFGIGNACSIDCAHAVAMARLAKQKAKAARADRVATKAKLDEYKTIPELKAAVQVVFNRYIRYRDRNELCICCGESPYKVDALTGGGIDAAHFRSRGSADHLRFIENNVHSARKYCNKYGHKDYRGGLIARIGLAAVEELEADNSVIKWTREGLLALKQIYTEKLKQLKTGR